ncbi:MAG: PLP-dependent transferase [Planctomycetota bacterium]|nr:PLP-dependent transferase [Planctomycetota bacterium]
MAAHPESAFATRCIHAGQRPDPSTGAIMTPVYFTSTFVQSSPGVTKDDYDYGRSKNPTRVALEHNLASLEGGRHGFAFASGLGAMDCVLHLLAAGDHVVLCDDVYGGSFRLVDKVFARLGIHCTRVDMTDQAATARAFTPSTRLVWVETPTNPMLKVIDIAWLASLCARHRVSERRGLAGPDPATLPEGARPLEMDRPLLVVDNTFATPFLQNPLSQGADVVMHSCTKYLGGHSDVIAGALACNDEAVAGKLKFLQNAVGAVPSPMDCFLLLRSTKTLHVRVQRHCENARRVAEYLEKQSSVERVIYPGLASHPQHEVARRQMRTARGDHMGGGMITLVLKGGLDRARRFLEGVSLFSLAESLGGVESLIEHPAIMTHASVPPENRRQLGIEDGLVRLSVGIEDADDLIADLETALRA